uniref:Uncharacterized protein n=1 Tax=Anopheles culicifacies TaxID=139723 RepID=A0A182M599_9DIPT
MVAGVSAKKKIDTLLNDRFAVTGLECWVWGGRLDQLPKRTPNRLWLELTMMMMMMAGGGSMVDIYLLKIESVSAPNGHVFHVDPLFFLVEPHSQLDSELLRL